MLPFMALNTGQFGFGQRRLKTVQGLFFLSMTLLTNTGGNFERIFFKFCFLKVKSINSCQNYVVSLLQTAMN